MLVQFILLFMLAVIYICRGRYVVCNRNYLVDKNIHKKVKNSIVLIGLFLLILIAFRGKFVGIDTPSYIWSYERLSTDSLNLYSSFIAENGFTLLEYIIKKLNLSFRYVIFIEAAAYIIPVCYIIFRYSRNPYLSLFYFISLDYFYFGMTGIRQTIAIGICLIAFEMAQRRELVKYLLLVYLATTFHSTAIIFFPVYFLGMVPFKKKYILIFILIGIIVFIFKDSIGNFIRQYSRIYYSDMATGGIGMYLFMLSVTILGLITSGKKWDDVLGENLIDNMMIVAVIIYPILQFNPTVFRLHYYYSIMVILFIPNMVKKIKVPQIHLVVNVVLFIITIYYYFFYTMQNMGVVPYVFGF